MGFSHKKDINEKICNAHANCIDHVDLLIFNYSLFLDLDECTYIFIPNRSDKIDKRKYKNLLNILVQKIRSKHQDSYFLKFSHDRVNTDVIYFYLDCGYNYIISRNYDLQKLLLRTFIREDQYKDVSIPVFISSFCDPYNGLYQINGDTNYFLDFLKDYMKKYGYALPIISIMAVARNAKAAIGQNQEDDDIFDENVIKYNISKNIDEIIKNSLNLQYGYGPVNYNYYQSSWIIGKYEFRPFYIRNIKTIDLNCFKQFENICNNYRMMSEHIKIYSIDYSLNDNRDLIDYIFQKYPLYLINFDETKRTFSITERISLGNNFVRWVVVGKYYNIIRSKYIYLTMLFNCLDSYDYFVEIIKGIADIKIVMQEFFMLHNDIIQVYDFSVYLYIAKYLSEFAEYFKFIPIDLKRLGEYLCSPLSKNINLSEIEEILRDYGALCINKTIDKNDVIKIILSNLMSDENNGIKNIFLNCFLEFSLLIFKYSAPRDISLYLDYCGENNKAGKYFDIIRDEIISKTLYFKNLNFDTLLVLRRYYSKIFPKDIGIAEDGLFFHMLTLDFRAQYLHFINPNLLSGSFLTTLSTDGSYPSIISQRTKGIHHMGNIVCLADFFIKNKDIFNISDGDGIGLKLFRCIVIHELKIYLGLNWRHGNNNNKNKNEKDVCRRVEHITKSMFGKYF